MSGLITGIIIIFVIINIMKKIANSVGNIKQQFTPVEEIPVQQSYAPPQNSTARQMAQQPKRRPPIDWNLVRENLNPEEIKACFDVASLSKGYTLKDLPQYVNLDQLRQYLPLSTLVEMVDLDFFEKAKKKAEVQEKPAPPQEIAAKAQPVKDASTKPMGNFQDDAFAETSPKAKTLYNPVLQGFIFTQILSTPPGLRRYFSKR